MADVSEAGLAREFGNSIIKQDPGAFADISKMLVGIADEFVELWKERFFELTRSAES